MNQTHSLTIVGTGIQSVSHITLAAKAWIEQADKVLFAVSDPVTAIWLQKMNKTAEPLPYDKSLDCRRETYQRIVAHILAELHIHPNVCVVFYGHPAVLTDAAHEARRQALEAGYQVRLLPGIAADACLWADLGLDPGKNGYQSFEATDFLIRQRQFDPHTPLVLWQIAMIGNSGFYKEGRHLFGLQILTETLLPTYGVTHEVIVYEAAVYVTCKPSIQKVSLNQLTTAHITEASTLYIPPKAQASVDQAMLARLQRGLKRRS